AVATSAPPSLAPETLPVPAVLSNHVVPLAAKERAGVTLAREWKAHGDRPSRGNDGRVVFPYGSSLPTIVCAPLFPCDLELQPGEVVIGSTEQPELHAGDKVRWKISPAISGPMENPASQITHVIIAPSDAGLSTNLIIPTNRRTYHVKLVSTKSDWMPRVAFSYPEDTAAKWAEYQQTLQLQQARTTLPGTGGQNVSQLDFGYEMKGKARWKPLRVYNDGTKTYIQFPASMSSSEAPALLTIGPDKNETLVNYRMQGDRYVVDQVFDRAVLVAGVGRRQSRITITREGL
ncbi:P-type conjugative transfer protein TrbG, partial [Xanthomonas phaseoli]